MVSTVSNFSNATIRATLLPPKAMVRAKTVQGLRLEVYTEVVEVEVSLRKCWK